MAEIEDLRRQLSLASTEDNLLEALNGLKESERAITSEIQSYVDSKQLSHDHHVQRLDLIRAELGTALNSSHDLQSMLSSASLIASRISSKVRNIDIEKERVQNALDYVNNVIELKACVVGVQDAMGTRDWERAANYIHKANSLPEDLITGDFANAMVPTTEVPDYPRETLDRVSTSLGILFLREFNKAASIKDMETVTRYFKLFPLIGQVKEGLEVYAKFICSIITAHSRTLMQSRSDGNNMFYAIAMSRLFENIALIVSQHAPVVERYYGKGRMARVVAKIQDEADSQGGLIMDTFWDERRIGRMISEINAYAFSFLVSSFAQNKIGLMNRSTSPADNLSSDSRRSEDEGVNLKDVGGLVNEASVMMHRWALYKKFLAVRWNDFTDAPSEDDDVPNVITSSGFVRKLTNRLQPAFETLATFVLRRSVEKAFQLDEFPDPSLTFTKESPLVTSVVDDVMFIFSTLVKQTIATGELSLIKNVCSNCRRVMESDYVNVIQRKLRDEGLEKLQILGSAITRTPTAVNKKKGGKVLLGLAASDERRLRNYLVLLNNLSVTSDYIDRILKDVNSVALSARDEKPVKDVLNSVSHNFASRCDSPLNQGIHEVFRLVNTKLRTICSQLFRDSDYMISPNTSSDFDMSINFGFLWDDLMKGFSKIMSYDNYTRLVTLAAVQLSRNLEKWVWSLEGKVNELGAIRIDRDVGRIITKVSEERYKLREKFVRVAQIVMIIGLDDTEDEEEITAWSLNEAERDRARLIPVERRGQI